MLQRFWLPALATAAIWLGLFADRAHGQPSRASVEIVDRTAATSASRFDIAVTGRALTPGECPVHQLDLRLTFDRTRLVLTDLALAADLADSCVLHFVLSDIGDVHPNHISIVLVLVARSETRTPHLTDSTARDLIALSFENLAPDHPEATDTRIEFCWINPNDNLLRARDSDTVLASSRVYDPDTVDIACPDCPLPSYRGLPDSLLGTLFNGDTCAARGVDFQSLRLLADQPTTVQEPGETRSRPVQIELYPNYPNPFNGETRISFDLSRGAAWRLTIVNLLGEIVWERIGYTSAGRHDLIWDGCDRSGRPVAAGVYLYRLECGGESRCRKLLLLK